MALTRSDYTDIVAAFTNAPDDAPPPSYRSVARALNHSARTIRTVYETGWNGLPSVAELLEQKRQRERFKRLQQAEHVDAALRGIHARLLKNVGGALAETSVNLQPITSAKDARQAVAALRELSDLAHDLYADERGDGTSVSVSVNVGVGDDRYLGKRPEHVATMKSAEAAMLRYPSLFEPQNEARTCELMAGTWLRSHPERDSDTDETIEQRALLQRLYPGVAHDDDEED